MAREIQKKFIPDKITYDNIYALYKPMEAVGGDFFDILHWDQYL